MNRLAGKTAIITGAGSGLGREIARQFAAEGAAVLVTDIDEAGGQETVAAITQAGLAGSASFQRLDVTSEDDCIAAVSVVTERWHRLDLLVANAGIARAASIVEQSREDWERVLAVNLTGPFLCAKHAFHAMQDTGGAILMMASVAGLGGTPGLGAYGPAKAGVIQLTQSLALAGAPYNIRVNALCPVWTDTPMVADFVNTVGGTNSEALRQQLQASIPLGRFGTPTDVANAAVFLASDAAAFISGVALPVDGAFRAR